VSIATASGSLHLLQLFFMLLVAHAPRANSIDAMLPYWPWQTRPAASLHVPYGNIDAKTSVGCATIYSY
jgi:hypothetical protein